MTNNRYIPLDILRGIAILNMMFVDAPPDFDNLYSIFVHSPWEGITIADLAFPGFVFVMGASLVFARKNKKRLRTSIWLKKICKRTAILFFIGIIFNAFPAILHFFISQSMNFSSFLGELFNNIRIMGVLQRLALVYFFSSLIIRFLNEKYLLLTAFCLLFISSIFTHIYSPTAPFLQDNNVNIYIDLLVLGENHILSNNPLYEPEGIFGTITSISSMIFGFYAAKLLMQKNYRGIVFFGSFTVFAGGIWSVFDIISKPLWSVPYALFTTGFFVFLFLIVELLCNKFGEKNHIFLPFASFGQNPIFFYLATNFMLIVLNSIYFTNGNSIYSSLYQLSVKGIVSDAFSSALFAFMWCLLWLPIAIYLYKKNIIIRI